jgi:hypothetical protein
MIVFRSLARCALPLVVAATVACEGSGSQLAGPAGGAVFSHYMAIGTALSMGTSASGVLFESQNAAWPTRLAAQAGVAFTVPMLSAPGCTPPLLAPLRYARYLSGTSTAVVDSSCAGKLGTITPPTDLLAIQQATAYAALATTPRVITATPTRYSLSDRTLYPIILGTTQSQVTAAIVTRPSLLSVELGWSEVASAVRSGQLIAATSYTQTAPFTFVPAPVFAPAFALLADSLSYAKAKVVAMGIPKVLLTWGLRTGAELAADRAGLAAVGIALATDCDGSANRVAIGTVVPPLLAKAQATGVAQPLSCADVPGAADGVVTPADIATISAATDAMNTQMKSIAVAKGWAWVDSDAALTAVLGTRPAFSAAALTGCLAPFGQYVGLDGLHPSASGQQVLANAAAAAVNAAFKTGVPSAVVRVWTAAELCPAVAGL